MGKEQFAQKVESDLNKRLMKLVNDYTEQGRIKEKGDILSILYNDHVVLEEKRNVKEMVQNIDELDNHLKRIEELFIQSSRSYSAKMDMLAKRNEDHKQLLEEKIKELEKVIQVQKDQLNEKTIALYEASKQIEKMEKKLKTFEVKTAQLPKH